MPHYLAASLIYLISAQCYAGGLKAGSYKLETRMLLPHLEEMRRIVTEETVCVEENDVRALFPILKQPGMVGCIFLAEQSSDKVQTYSLQCPGKNAAKGTATLEVKENKVNAELNAKMGGKNMTFSQFSNAELVGQCSN